ncbi:hypothetical protein [Paracoccus aurantius]
MLFEGRYSRSQIQDSQGLSHKGVFHGLDTAPLPAAVDYFSLE